MKSFESEMGAAKAKAGEQAFVDQHTGEGKVLVAFDVPELSLESSQSEEARVAEIRKRTTGTVDDLRVSEESLRAQGVTAGVNPEKRITETVSAKEYFSTGEQSPLVESDALAALRVKDPAMADRYTKLKRDFLSRQTDIMDLEQKVVSQKDEVLKAAFLKVLAQFKRERATLQKEVEEIEKSF